ncbi:hypothetical protein BJX61DRAFT_389136 [Aspergillus egyptiacus]|nr:hypothetical protein BJX61DRAFT_389136 [Aspergillus egyptiacus]
MSDRAQEALRAETKNLSALASDVAFSGAYLYPFKGILHLIRSPSLYRPLFTRLLQTALYGVGITTALFVFTYIPQTTLLAFITGPFAPLSAALLVLAEASALTALVARGFVLREALVDTFDAVLLSRGHESLVSKGRELKASGRGRGVMGRLGRVISRPFSGVGMGLDVSSWVRGLVMLPLNFVPVVGTLVYVYVNGKRVGVGLHERYFALRGMSDAERREWVEGRRGGYTGLGMAAVVLEMVPFVSMVFEVSNAVGAALWASDMEKARK